MEVRPSDRMSDISYDIRGPLLNAALALERVGEKVIKLNIGDPAAFGVSASHEVVEAAREGVVASTGYGDAQGSIEARDAVAADYRRKGLSGIDPSRVFIGNGVSELVPMALEALLNPGDEVLIPTPGYPLWAAATTLASGRPVCYTCDERADWQPDLADLEARISSRTRAIVVINPNNPTGAVWPAEALERIAALAATHGLMIMADEIYDEIVYDGLTHVPCATRAPDVVCLTFGGLSKRFRLPGFRIGWMAVSGPASAAASYLDALAVLAALRLCPNVVVQHAVPAALDGDQTIQALTAPGGRLALQRDVCWKLLISTPGITCVKPQGAFYAFPRLDPAVHGTGDDEQFALEFLKQEKVLVVPGTGMGWPNPDHLRMVTLAPARELKEAITRLARLLDWRISRAAASVGRG